MQFNERQLEIINDCACNTHTLWLEASARKVEAEFPGAKVHVWTQKNETHYKGAHLDNGVQKARVTDSESILRAIARSLNHTWVRADNFEGRGFRVSAMAQELLGLQDKEEVS